MNSEQRCQERPAGIRPVIDRNRCEAKAECVRVCPYNVFELRVLGAEDKLGMSLLGRLKARIHGNRQAFVERPEACHACGLCVSACPEGAITLQKGG
jgi:4Fe-4S ferredoxin